jgi:anaphase-promoting complex subunit 3
MLSAAPQADTTSLSDKGIPTNGPLQTQLNSNPNIDPFTSNTFKGEPTITYGSSALWEKLNGSTVSVASVGPTVIHEGSDTPVSQNEPDDLRMVNGIVPTGDTSWEPPLAPARRNRTVQQVEYGDPPPRMKTTALKSRVRSKPESDETSQVHIGKESVPAPPIGDRKRTVSGQVAHPVSQQPSEPGAPQRRSVRLFNQIRPTTSKLASGTLGTREGREVKKVKATGTKGRTTTASTVGRVVSGNRKPIIDASDADNKEHRVIGGSHNSTSNNHAKAAVIDRSREVEALSWLLDLFGKVAGGYFALTRYECQDAIQIFNTLPQPQRETPWVLSQIGRAYYEQAMYPEAEKYFIRVKALAPSRLEDMEIYSTVLWHLKNDVELAYLAHELTDVDRLSPQAWCAVGNSFSHQRDHDQALKCFKRATQLDSRFAYAFTLQGHEYVANEEYDKALDAYRNGISADNRHYNAWYGLGTVYEKMGKLEIAEQHFRNAAGINPNNAVLVCCIGLVLEKMNNPKAALIQYGRASSLAPQSILARFRKARALMKLQELKLALVELKVLKDIAPDEANVHFLLGKLYKMLHDKANAIKHFTTALNLDPKVSRASFDCDWPSADGSVIQATQYIKDAMEALDDEDDDDAEMA